jgi:hypothetical protein
MVSGSIDPRTAALISVLLTWYNAIHSKHVSLQNDQVHRDMDFETGCRMSTVLQWRLFRYVRVSQPVSRDDSNATAFLQI